MAESLDYDLLIQEAQTAMTREDWGAAVAKLQAVLDLDPTNTEAAQKLRHAKQQQKLAALYVQGRQHYEAGRWLEALECFRQVQDLGGNYKQADLIVATIKKRLAKRQRQYQIAAVYHEAQAELARENWATAIAKLQVVLDLQPTHEEAAAKLSQARQQQELASLYFQGRRHYEAGHWRVALEYFHRIRKIAGDYKDVSTLIATAEGLMAGEEALRTQPQGESNSRKRLWIIVPTALVLLLVVCGGGYLVYGSLIRVPTATAAPVWVSTYTPVPPSLTAPPTNTSFVPNQMPSTISPPTPRPLATSTPIPTLTFTAIPMLTPTPTFTLTPPPAPLPTPTSTPMFTPTPTFTPEPAPTPTPTATSSPTVTPTASESPSPSPTFTFTPTTTTTPSSTVTSSPTVTPTASESPSPTFTPAPTTTATPPPTATSSPTPVPLTEEVPLP